MKRFLQASQTVLIVAFEIGLLWVGAYLITWLTPFAFIRTEHSSEIGYDGASFWHSGLPLRYMVRSDISNDIHLDNRAFWADVIFWFAMLLLGAGFLATRKRRIARAAVAGKG